MKTETIVMGNRDYPLVALRHRLSCWTSSFKQGTSAYRRHIAPGWVLRRMKTPHERAAVAKCCVVNGFVNEAQGNGLDGVECGVTAWTGNWP